MRSCRPGVIRRSTSTTTGPYEELKAGRTESLDVQIGDAEAGLIQVEVTAVNSVDGTKLAAKHQIEVVTTESQATTRTLRWTSYVMDYPTFFNGGRHDRHVNAGPEFAMPTDCRVTEALGLLVDRNGDPAAGDTPALSVDRGDRGFTIIRPLGLPESQLEVVVHHWHGAINAVRTTVVYNSAAAGCRLRCPRSARRGAVKLSLRKHRPRPWGTSMKHRDDCSRRTFLRMTGSLYWQWLGSRSCCLPDCFELRSAPDHALTGALFKPEPVADRRGAWHTGRQ